MGDSSVSGSHVVDAMRYIQRNSCLIYDTHRNSPRANLRATKPFSFPVRNKHGADLHQVVKGNSSSNRAVGVRAVTAAVDVDLFLHDTGRLYVVSVTATGTTHAIRGTRP
jgi:hypothetical protein